MQDCGIVRTYCKSLDGNEYIEEEYFQIDGKKHGLYTHHDHKGFKVNTIEYVDGLKHGEYISYHNFSNNISYKCHYNNGIKVGEAIFYYENGQIDNICNYKDGKIEGMRYWYFESDDNSPGNIKKSCNHIDGLRQGECIIYYSNGTIKSIWNYVDDEIIYN
jgi:antitoxin component YwqK of YwqJK toxin-antitoxin module